MAASFFRGAVFVYDGVYDCGVLWHVVGMRVWERRGVRCGIITLLEGVSLGADGIGRMSIDGNKAVNRYGV